MDALVAKKNTNVSFMTTKDRELFPTSMAPDRLGNEMNPMTGTPNTGPGCYDNENKTNLEYLLATQVMSQRGYTLGARTAKRFAGKKSTVTPGPQDYQKNFMRPKTIAAAYVPFDSELERFHENSFALNKIPGPGTYKHDEKRNKHVEWHQAFGGKPINLPQIDVQSTIKCNTKKLYGTNEENQYQRKLAYFKLFF